MITITALKWAPPFATGNVRDHRVRWILNEVEWPYRVRLLSAVDLSSGDYRSMQPFGQVPALEEKGRPPLFESGAIVLDVATRAGRLMPKGDADRSLVTTWVVAALNTIEPPLINVAEVAYFLKDEEQKRQRWPLVTAAANKRLDELEMAIGERTWLVGTEFTVADLMMASVLKIARNLGLLDGRPAILRYQDRCLDRPAYRKAITDQQNDIARHSMDDMKYDEVDS